MKLDKMNETEIGIAQSGKTKAEHYDWATIRKRGVERMMPLDSLCVDRNYQRDEVSQNQTIWKAKNFDIDLCGHLLISLRKCDGRHYIIDGQQRFLAAKRRGDIKHLPCVIRECANMEEEAALFCQANLRRSAVKPWHKWRAALVAGLSPEKDIAESLALCGVKVVREATSAGTASCPALLGQIWSIWPKLFQATIRNALVICTGEKLDNEVIKGCLWLLSKGVCVDDHAHRIAQKGGANFVKREIRSVELQTGTKGAPFRSCGLGLLEAINKNKHGQRVKVELT
jgi:hypothetical protein